MEGAIRVIRRRGVMGKHDTYTLINTFVCTHTHAPLPLVELERGSLQQLVAHALADHAAGGVNIGRGCICKLMG